MKSDYERQVAVEFYRHSRDQEADGARLAKLAREAAQNTTSAQVTQQPLLRRWRLRARWTRRMQKGSSNGDVGL